MKFITILLLFIFLIIQTKSYCQKVTLHVKKASIESVIREVTKQTGFQFLYNQDIIKKAKDVTIDADNIAVSIAVQMICSAAGLDYKIVDKTIIITGAKQSTEQQTNVPQNIQLVITGKIENDNKEPLSNVSILNTTTGKGKSTGENGMFSIRGEKGEILQISSVGYEDFLYTINEAANPTITLQTKVAELSETVVIGYGTVQKKDVTGSVSIISTKDIQDVPFMTVDNAIAGKAAGVQVTKTDGTPGGAVRIRVRGSTSLLGGNDPLYVIDGVPVQVKSNYINPGFDVRSPVADDIVGVAGLVSTGMSAAFVNGLNSLGTLNIDDIESITILKDASSTAIYGSKAANGVVIITTKKGKKDMKPQITFDYSGTFSRIIRKPNLLNASQYKMLLTEGAVTDSTWLAGYGAPPPPDVDAILHTPGTFFGKANTDWVDLVTRNTFSNNAQISIQGGGSATKYYSSIAFNSTPGVVIATDYQRVAGKINIENEIGSRFSFITNLDLGYTNQNLSNGVYAQALRARPDYAAYDSLGKPTSFSTVDGRDPNRFINPLALATATNNSKMLNLLGSLTALYNITKSLQFKSTASLNFTNYNQRNYTPSYIGVSSFAGANTAGIGSNSTSQLTSWFIENTLTYNHSFHQKHDVNILAGTSYETNKTSFFSATAYGYPNDDILNNLSSAVTPLRVQGDNPGKPQSYLVSFYARANYGYLDKYLVTFTGRADGSSKFGPDNKFGYFPSGALAWRISKETFLKKVNWIDDIKLRGSYGLTGTQNIGNQMYRTLYSPTSYRGASALIPTQLGNAAIQWEQAKETDLGIDFSFFKNRLQGTADYYHKQSQGVLLSLPVTPSSSYASLLYNAAGIKNTGYELSLQGDIIRTKDFRWNASVNITWNKSIVTQLNPEASRDQIGNLTGLEYQNTALVQGQPLGLITALPVTGIIKTQKELDDYKAQLTAAGYINAYPFLGLGDPMYGMDSVTHKFNYGAIAGHGAPKYFGGFTQGFTYKNFDMNFYFTYSVGGELMWADHVGSIQFRGTSNSNAVMLNRYTPEHPTDQPRLIYDSRIYTLKTSLSIFNSSYVKLRTVTFNYRLKPSGFLQKASVKNASVYLSVTNLFTITRYPGNNPETSDDPYSVGGGYFDASNYPNTKTFTAGVKVGF